MSRADASDNTQVGLTADDLARLSAALREDAETVEDGTQRQALLDLAEEADEARSDPGGKGKRLFKTVAAVASLTSATLVATNAAVEALEHVL